jgi:hypothetical protein
LNIPKYKLNRWVLLQEQTQRNLLHALKPLMKEIQPSKLPQKVLIEGITFPFHPFAFPQSLRVFPNAKYANFDIVNYDTSRICGVRTDLVRFVNMKDVRLANYQEEWIFDDAGKLVKRKNHLEERLSNRSDSSERTMEISLENFSQFVTSGFYSEENGFRWTNGKAAILMNAVVDEGDSVIITLNTYLPTVCKDIRPQLNLTSTNNELYQPVESNKNEDSFQYLFVPGKKDSIQLISISSEIINSSPDQRVLSFPFKSLETKILKRIKHP